MLAHIGRTTLPPEILQKADSGTALSSIEKDLLTQVPETGSMLLANIPRLEIVSGIVLYQNKRWDGSGFPFNSVSGTNIPLGARILAVIRALDQLERTGMSRGQALGELARDQGAFDPDVLKAATSWLPSRKNGVALPLRHVTVAELRPGHVLRSNVITSDGLMLIGIGQVITQPLIGRLSGFMRLGTIKEPLIVEELPT
jgi:HD-GYP domain-containing protein (c-di-GMP phosphodiesterase class II)